jgi:hypothetical protein
VEPNADERKRAMGFPTGMTFVPSISEASSTSVGSNYGPELFDLDC